jgi:hypothetical protein
MQVARAELVGQIGVRTPREARFIVVLEDATLQGTPALQPTSASFGGLEMRDSQGRSWRATTDDYLNDQAKSAFGGASPSYNSSFRLQPGTPVRIIHVFEVAPDAGGFTFVGGASGC